MARPGSARHPQWRRRRGVGAGVTCGQTFDGQVAASEDDAREKEGGTSFSKTSTVNSMTSHTTDAQRYNAGMLFKSVTVPAGATIEAATLDLYVWHASADSPNCAIYAEDVDSAVDFDADADVASRVKTGESVEWSEVDLATGQFHTSPDFMNVIQEIVDRPGWVSTQNICIIGRGKNDITREFAPSSYDRAAAEAPKLHIQYCA